MNRRKAAIIYGKAGAGGSPDEKDTLVQADAVRGSLHRLGWDTVDLPVTLDLSAAAEEIQREAPRIAFNLVESLCGKGRLIALIPSLLDSLGIPYTGARAEAMFLTSNKLLAKIVLSMACVRTPPWITASDLLGGKAPEFPAPFIVKQVWEHASIGLDDEAVCRTVDALRVQVEKRSRGGSAHDVYAEPYVEGREFNLALLGGAGNAENPMSLPPSEIQFIGFSEDRPRVVGYQAKWVEDSYEFKNTPRTFDFPAGDSPLLEQLVGISRSCWRLFELRGYARVDFRVDRLGMPWVLEINANPCIAPDAGFMAAAARAELDMDAVVGNIIADTIGKDEA